MSKFRITVERTDEFEIEVDENIYTAAELSEWSKVFTKCNSLEEFAEILATQMSRLGSDQWFFEGFGYVQVLRNDGSERKIFNGSGEVSAQKITPGIKVRVISEDEDLETTIHH